LFKVKLHNYRMRILFFIGSLRTGGKERRLIELLTWLKQQRAFELFVVLAFDHIDYPAFHKLEIEHVILNKKPNLKDPRVFMRLYKLCKSFKPDVLHTWGSMQAFYLAPIAKILKVPLVNSQITSARPKRKKFNFSGLINSFNFLLSDKILSNSIAGLESFGLSKSDKKCKVIYNGFNPERIQNLPTKAECRKKFGIETNYAVVMVGSFSENKDYQRLLDVCRHMSNKRSDITFIAAGDGKNLDPIKKKAGMLGLASIKFTGRINNIEELISASDIGVLFSPNGEGISNAIMEYMALGKPVIANDAGGTKEIVAYNESGYLITNESNQEIAYMIIELIDNPEKRFQFGKKGQEIILNKFSLESMGQEFEELYLDLLSNKY
jgi:glycosyltransferase involved in cell wall biosynthesis